MSDRSTFVAPEDPSRRAFCGQACQAVSLAAAATLLGTACGGGGPTSPSGSVTAPPLASVNGSVNGRTVSITIEAGSPLASTGTAAIVRTSIGAFLVSRAGDAFTVLTAVCTHQGCEVTGFTNTRYVCPCHGSQFTTSGTVSNGPATRALQAFNAQFAGGVVTFTA